MLAGEDYLELLPVKRRAINAYGIRVDHRTYDCAELGPYRRQHSGDARNKGLWEVHYDPYDLSQVFLRTPAGWVSVPWTHKPMVSGPFADFTWNHARRLAAQRGLDPAHETEVARVLDELLTRAHDGPTEQREQRVAARTRVAAATHQPPSRAHDEHEEAAAESQAETGPVADVVPMGIFDAHAEAERWL